MSPLHREEPLECFQFREAQLQRLEKQDMEGGIAWSLSEAGTHMGSPVHLPEHHLEKF
jgi:hypothetical protein